MSLNGTYIWDKNGSHWFKRANELSWSLFGIGELIEDIRTPVTGHDTWVRDNENRHAELISLRGRKIEVHDR